MTVLAFPTDRIARSSEPTPAPLAAPAAAPVPSPRYVSCADTAKLVRVALKAAFPAVKFSVRSHTYSGGATINVRWTDGPTVRRVEAVAGQFAGATFDGSQDLKTSHVSVTPEGEQVRYAADFVHCTRDASDRHWDAVARCVADYYGITPCPTRAEAASRYVASLGEYFSTLVFRALNDRTTVER